MLVRYERTLADMDILYDYYCDLTVTKKAIARYRTRMSIALGLITFGAGLTLSPTAPFIPVLVGVVVALIFALRAKAIYTRAVRQNIRRSYAPNSGAHFDKEVELELLETGFIVRTERMETKFPWKTLERIDSRPGYTFLCIDALNAIIIPHKGIVAGDFPGMLSELGRRFQASHRPEIAAE